MSLLSQAIIAARYGLRLTLDQLAEALSMAKNTIYNQVSAGTFPVPTYIDGNKRFADYRDVATYLDSCRERATTLA
jgi:predicted DNA-binding transcriptional regulator AlpA